MALANEIMGCSLSERSLFASSSSRVLLRHSFQQKQTPFLISPVLVPLENRRMVRLRKAAKFPVAAISEDLVRDPSSSSSSSSSTTTSSSSSSSSSSVPVPVPLPAEKPVKFRVRAVVTVRNKIKEDFKETLVKHFDALTDKIGRNVVLELVSTEIDPSKTFLEILITLPNDQVETFFFFSLFGCAIKC